MLGVCCPCARLALVSQHQVHATSGCASQPPNAPNSLKYKFRKQSFKPQDIASVRDALVNSVGTAWTGFKDATVEVRGRGWFDRERCLTMGVFSPWAVLYNAPAAPSTPSASGPVSNWHTPTRNVAGREQMR